MGILDGALNAQNNCNTDGFDEESMDTLSRYSHNQIYVGSNNNHYLDETDYEENNLIGIYNAADWRLYHNPIDKPFEEYDSTGSITYFWYYGDVVDLEFNLNGEMVVEDDAIVYYYDGQTPTENTSGIIGQKAYNIVNSKEWTLIAIDGTSYLWQEDEQYNPPLIGNRRVYFTIQDYIRDKNVCIKLQDFKYNTIYEQDYSGDQQLILHISKELSNNMVPGVYYVQLAVVDQNSKDILLGINRYRLLVK